MALAEPFQSGMLAKVVIAALVAVLGLPCQAQTIWRMDVDGADVAKALDISVYRFRYEVPEGRYRVDTWLERWDRGTSEAQRLTVLSPVERQEMGQTITGGTILLSLIDDASPMGRGDGTLRGMITREDRGFGQTFTTRIPVKTEDFLKTLTRTQTHPVEELKFRVGDELTLLTIGGGESADVTGITTADSQNNDRILVLKARFTPVTTAAAKLEEE